MHTTEKFEFIRRVLNLMSKEELIDYTMERERERDELEERILNM